MKDMCGSMEEDGEDYVCYVRNARLTGGESREWQPGEAYHLSLILRYFSQPIRDEPVTLTIRFYEGYEGTYECSSLSSNEIIRVERQDRTRSPIHILFCRRERTEQTLALNP